MDLQSIATERIGGISTLDSAASRRALDALNAGAEARTAAAEHADAVTRKAREEIQKLARGLTQLEACALIACLQDAIERSTFGHREAADHARDCLADAHYIIESSERGL